MTENYIYKKEEGGKEVILRKQLDICIGGVTLTASAQTHDA